MLPFVVQYSSDAFERMEVLERLARMGRSDAEAADVE